MLTYGKALRCWGSKQIAGAFSRNPFATYLKRRRHAHPLTGRILSSFGAPQWNAVIYLDVRGGALAFILRVLALERATPTCVANTMTVNPIAADLLATQLVGLSG